MVIDDVAKLVDGYYCILDQDSHFTDVLQFSPFDGRELPGSLLIEIRHLVGVYLLDNDEIKHAIWLRHLRDDTPRFNIELVPKEKKYLLKDREWYTLLKSEQRLDHHGGKFCWRMGCCFIEDCYECHPLPKLACVPIKYCPFCGVKLPPEFDQENWWEKEFKTFKWDKDHKLGEWADDYVDDHDWTEADYPLTEEEKAEYMEK